MLLIQSRFKMYGRNETKLNVEQTKIQILMHVEKIIW